MDITLSSAESRGGGSLYRRARRLIDVLEQWGAPIADLAVRIWVGLVFFQSGLTKIASWDSTLYLFENEYHVPVLPPVAAAWLGTGAELVLPVFLVLGLAGRLSAAALFAFNIVAVLSYPDLGEIGLRDHQVWGLMLLVTLCHGAGKLSVDHLVRRRFEQ